MLNLWVTFAVLTGLIYLAGSRLSYYGDVLGEKWGVERSFIGLLLLSSITSLPELVTSGSAVALVDSPNLAMGNVLGSNLFNIFILPLLALMYREAFLHRADIRHSSTASLVLFIYALVGLGIAIHLLPVPAFEALTVLHLPGAVRVSPVSVLILVMYMVGVYTIFSEQEIPEAEGGMKAMQLYSDLSRRWVLIVFGVCAAVVVGAGAGMSVVGKQLAVRTGLGETFFGSLFFAFVTSLPELVVSLAALKQLNAVNLAVGNLLGSCLFNLGIIVVFDLLAPGSALFSDVSPSHFISVFGGIMMVSMTSYALFRRRAKASERFYAPELIVLALLYIATLYMLFALGGDAVVGF